MVKFYRGKSILVVLALFLALRYASCGGGNSQTVENVSVAQGHEVTWNPPVSYVDYSPLDFWDELDVYELYVNDTGAFSEYDSPAACISANDADGFPVTSFDLGNLDYPFEPGETYFISMRSVTKLGAPSDFSAVFPFMIPVFLVEG